MTRQLVAAATLAALCGAAAPSFAAAQDRTKPRNQAEHRVYDRTHRDYHVWNDDEDRTYRAYLSEHHMTYRKFPRLTAKRQNNYWKWRHEHDPDRR